MVFLAFKPFLQRLKEKWVKFFLFGLFQKESFYNFFGPFGIRRIFDFQFHPRMLFIDAFKMREGQKRLIAVVTAHAA